MTRKIFCVGFQKTGTTSLGFALEKLGLRVGSYRPFRIFAEDSTATLEDVERHALSLLDEYDAVKDTPWPLFYKTFDQKFEDAKFIHVVRDTDKWIRSVVDDFNDYPNHLHDLIYGHPFPKGHEGRYIERYERHNREVGDYFSGRPDRYLRLSLDRGEVGWEKIAPFLGVEAPSTGWPKANTKRDKRMRMTLQAASNKFWRLLGKRPPI